ncbi:glycosyltransferase [Calothrix sp. FACHB-1219]|uniref:glycosyltransferase family 2 protein n=1 Tax=unclassified Calothrix TaxID=2619626 RepID=UPI0016851ACE|nr:MULTISPECIES: glycosyltransferase [unclassified Calothrix]MBD2206524.1 glycosyltransferase [Calothrix sp. FACHB-168]MBD2221320.1 glycosyltransferase [Calothrix sp. FACHB-1219]
MNTLQPPPNLPLLDISIVTYNSAQWIENFFKSLLEQSYPTKLINILITDNQSSDRTITLCKLFLDKYADYFHSLKIFERPNLGFGCGHNYNLAQSTSPYFLVSNVDLEFEKDAIINAVNTAIADDEDVASWEFRQKPFEHPKYYHPVTLETYWSAHACILFRRSAIEYVKGYEEKIFLYGEDVELSYRLRDNGFRIKYCPASVCWHYTYEYPNQVKRLQFLGSTLANSYIRLRYGSIRQIAVIPLMYLKLFLAVPCIDNQWQGLLKNMGKILKNSLYFLLSRKQTNKLFPINKWDYCLTRDGAFYRYTDKPHNSLPLVSVIIRTYKGRLSYLKEAVTSVLHQTYPNIELVVVEDGSNNAQDYIEQVAKTSHLKVIYQAEPKRGRCHTGNVGLAHTTGKFIAFLDDDDLFFAEHIEVLVNELLAHPEVAATYSISWEVATKVISKEPLHYLETSYNAIYRQPFSRALMWHHNYIPIQSILFDRKLYDNYGGFDESLENLEDWNLWTRYCLNHDFLLICKTTSLYRVPDTIDEWLTRKQTLDSYYAIAVEKQKSLIVTLSIPEFMELYRDLASYDRMILNAQVPSSWKDRLKSILFKINLIKILYYYYSNIKRRRNLELNRNK